MLGVFIYIDEDGAVFIRVGARLRTRFHDHTNSVLYGRQQGAGIILGANFDFVRDHADGQIVLILLPQSNTAVAIAHLG